MGSNPSQPMYPLGYVQSNPMPIQGGYTPIAPQVSNQVPPTLPAGQLNLTFGKDCLKNNFDTIAQSTSNTVLDKGTVGAVLQQCALINGTPLSQMGQQGQAQLAANTMPNTMSNTMPNTMPNTGVRESFNEQFAGVTQSADGSSVCVTYNALFWLIIIIIVILLIHHFASKNAINALVI
jgi:hypothetical protein